MTERGILAARRALYRQPPPTSTGTGMSDVGDESAFLDAWYAPVRRVGDRSRARVGRPGPLGAPTWAISSTSSTPGSPTSRWRAGGSRGLDPAGKRFLRRWACQDGPAGPDNPVGFAGISITPRPAITPSASGTTRPGWEVAGRDPAGDGINRICSWQRIQRQGVIRPPTCSPGLNRRTSGNETLWWPTRYCLYKDKEYALKSMGAR